MIGREMVIALFSDLPPTRKREAASAIGHFIAGVLDRDSMTRIVEELCRAADLQPGCRARTLRGSLRGTITRVFDDGRVALRPDTGGPELISLPENLLPDDPPGA
jgi:hypothetical protein